MVADNSGGGAAPADGPEGLVLSPGAGNDEQRNKNSEEEVGPADDPGVLACTEALRSSMGPPQ